MSVPPIVYPPSKWRNQDIVLYHGTIDVSATAIMTGIRIAMGKPSRDFGPGFYTTTLLRQAQKWAEEIARTKSSTPAVVQITVQRDALAQLETLAFVLGHDDVDNYWSFVHHCRLGALTHGRPGPQPNYDGRLRPCSGAMEPA